MEDSFDYRLLVPQTDPEDELSVSLTSFSLLYSQRRDRLQRVSESFALTAARLHGDPPENKTARVVFAVFGGALGAGCGVMSGGVCEILGAISATTVNRICGQINAVGATVGFFGSVLGGVIGGVFCGAIGGAIGATAGPPDSPVHDVTRDVVWFTVGGVTGGAIGATFGGTVGAAGGAVGGAFGGVCATKFTVFLAGSIFGRFSGNKDFNRQSQMFKNQKVIQDSAGDFRETFKPLLEEMRTIKSINQKMSDREAVQSVATQIEKTLDAVITLEITLSDSQRATDLHKFVSSVDEAARQSRKTTEELQTTSEEVEKLLGSLRKH
ncbi:uncharacterized protein LOC117829829 [Xyrichtys novacula]|uniref:Uncharacterized protein LOC117829829 n=1 Tax=Xyrichtys novacula TaxID=13765 RepID=A0AAV1H9R8_XYRNO|nr:uncharacterized protein LOC117829829 [Xyrichtys novacula]